MGARDDLATLEQRLTALLPQEYQEAYDEVEPVPMGSAGLKYGEDGRVAWNEIWQSFCDLALAGGPPHKGKLLEPATPGQIAADPAAYDLAVREICRGIGLVTDMVAEPSPRLGWVRVECDSDGMAGWLLRAIAMENVAVWADGASLDLPAGPHYRIDKEIKNVVTVIAKTCHYWAGHMWRFEQRAIGALFDEMAASAPLIVPQPYANWRGVACPTIRSAVWMTRLLVASNVLARREDTTIFVPQHPEMDPDGTIVSARLANVRRHAVAKGLLSETPEQT